MRPRPMTSQPRSDGTRPNNYPAPCALCGREVPARRGDLVRDRQGHWVVTHHAPHWVGSPVSGRYVGGCDDVTTSVP
jgi:hypothetical protein